MEDLLFSFPTRMMLKSEQPAFS